MTNLESTSVKKIISDLEAEGFAFHEDYDETDERRFGKFYCRRKLENVVFEKDNIQIKIFNDLFFRVSGMSHLWDEKLEKPVKLSDADFYEMQKHIIRYLFNCKLEKLKELQTARS
jgi:hypothetical protein